ncbi:MAG: inosine/xanthosine triphosphatase [Chloroflexota bacterium]|nr:MAG: inositol monophosphatase [Chloroflexota bacterium]
MNRIVVASANPVKVEATLQGFQRLFPDQAFSVEGIEVESGVSSQPMSDEETLRGARNRAEAARAQRPEASFWVGIEGGVAEDGDRLLAFAWIVVLGRERSGSSRTATFILPEEVAALVRQGVELGHADDRVFGRTDSKRRNGSVGLLTGDVIDRVAYYAHAVVLALIPFKNPDLTFAG